MAGGTGGELGHIVTLNVRGTCLNSRSSPGACSALSVGAFLRMPPALLCLNSSVQAPQAAEGPREGTAEKSRERAAEKPRRREQRWTRAALRRRSFCLCPCVCACAQSCRFVCSVKSRILFCFLSVYRGRNIRKWVSQTDVQKSSRSESEASDG